MKTNFTADYSVITFATGKTSYLKFALNCARSILVWNEIKFYIVTDLTFQIPDEIKKNIVLIDVQSKHLNQGTGIKLYIDHYLQTKYTLFIDADCLCYASLKPIFTAFAGKNVSAVGNLVSAEDWCGKIQSKSILDAFNLNRLARFNGGVYYISKTEQAYKIYNKARKIALLYNDLGFDRIHNNWLNEEILISIAMGLYHELPIPDDGKFMTDLYTDLHTSKLNVLTGFRQINNPIFGNKYHREWYPTIKLKPIIIHFGSSNLYRYPYISQHLLFKLKSKIKYTFLTSLFVKLSIHFPFKTKYWLADKLR